MAIKELKEIEKLTLDDLYWTLKAHEVRVNCTFVKTGEKALHVKGESTSTSHKKGGHSGSSYGDGRGRGRSFTSVSRRGWNGLGRGSENKSHIQCFQCKRIGHVKAECRARRSN